MESKVLGGNFGMKFFMCENYEYDPPKRHTKDRPKRLHRLYAISCSGWTPSSHSLLRTMSNAKEGGLGKGGSECCTRNQKRRGARKSKRRSGEGWRR
ncbi:hypothetical protein C2845_PM04G16340 [Panicum miliaceum]|uniref:Uncharacterized protein n=1 Tax=Panicum miliaceum TaxID=4540 RepID=A0A3L6QNT3_PANMI|nr:hypothetical protein C2845_PM04G16340 [Panicum miliaceum]